MTEAYKELMSRSTPSGRRPVIVTLGGDHSIALAALRGVNSVYGPVSVIHFDARIFPSPLTTGYGIVAND